MQRTINHTTHTGPGLLRLHLPVGQVTVTASPATTQTSVTLTPERVGDQSAADAIERTQVTQTGDLLAVTVPATTSGGVTQTVLNHGGRVSVSMQAQVITGSVTGVTISRDGQISVGVGDMQFGTLGGGVRATVWVPAGQRVEIDTDSADITIDGPVGTVCACTGSGDVRVDQADKAELNTGSGDVILGCCGSVQARTGSGDVHARRLHTGTIRTGSGDIDALAVTGRLVLRAGSGDITAHLAAEVAALTAATGSGDIEITAEPGLRIDRSELHTGSGRITTG